MLIIFICLITLSSSIPTITSVDVSVSGLLPILTYFISAWIFCFLDAEFSTFIILTVYLGAVTITSPSTTMTSKNYMISNLFMPNIFFLLLLIYSVLIFSLQTFDSLKINHNFIISENILLTEFSEFTDIEEIGFLLYNFYFPITIVCFLLSSVAMLVIYRILK